MQAIDHRFEIIHRRQIAPRTNTASLSLRTGYFFTKSLFSVLFAALVLTIGPTVLQTVAAASAELLHALLQLVRISLFVLEILGR
jgi:hypothetical protein